MSSYKKFVTFGSPKHVTVTEMLRQGQLAIRATHCLKEHDTYSCTLQ